MSNTEPNNWKDRIIDPQEPAQSQPAKEWFTEFELEFIEKEIITKLIEELPDGMYKDATDARKHFYFHEFKQFLKGKWL